MYSAHASSVGRLGLSETYSYSSYKDKEKLDLPFVLCRTLLNAERNASAKTGSESGLYPIFAVFTEDKHRFVQI